MSAPLQQVDERRRLRRWHLVLYLRVFDHAGEVIGHLANISQDGMMTISDRPLEIGHDYDLWLELPCVDDGPGNERLALRAHSVRSDQDVNPSFYDTGFKLLDASQDTVNRLAQLISDLRMGS